MAWLIILLSLAMFIGSWMWLMPTPQQKRIAKLRQNAVENGFRAKFVSQANFIERFSKFVSTECPEEQIVRYTWMGKAPELSSGSFLVSFNEEGEPLIPNDYPLFDQLLSLGQWMRGLLVLECEDIKGKRTFSLYWTEQGDVANIHFEDDKLTGLLSQIWPKAPAIEN